MTKIYSSVNIKVPTPDGTIFVNIVEDDTGAPFMIDVITGKSGSPIAAWAQALSSIISLALQSGVSFNSVMQNLSNITSDRSVSRLAIGSECRSGPEGIYFAMIRYWKDKSREVNATLGIKEDDFKVRLAARK